MVVDEASVVWEALEIVRMNRANLIFGKVVSTSQLIKGVPSSFGVFFALLCCCNLVTFAQISDTKILQALIDGIAWGCE